MFVLAVWVLCWFNVDEVEWHFSVFAFSESDNSFALSMDSLIFANDDIVSRLPLKATLPRNDVVGHHLLTSKLF
jgi:hypothetical protein